MNDVSDHLTAIFPTRNSPSLTGFEINVAFLVYLQILISQIIKRYTNLEYQNNLISIESREGFLYAPLTAGQL